MITAEQARQLMPNVGEILTEIENMITQAAERGNTNIMYTFRKANAVSRSKVKSILIELGYSLSEYGNQLKISWKKL